MDIAPNNYTIKFKVANADDDYFKKVLYGALDRVSSKYYLGGDASKIDSKRIKAEKSFLKQSPKKTKKLERESMKQQIKKDKKNIDEKSNIIHNEISKAQIAYRQAARARFVPNNTFKVGGGSFFVENQGNGYVLPKEVGVRNYNYIIGGKKPNRFSEIEILNGMLEESSQIGSLSRERKKLEKLRNNSNSFSGRLAIVRYIFKNYRSFPSYRNLSSKMNLNELKIFSPKAGNYDYTTFKISPLVAKYLYKNFPNSIKNSSGIYTLFLASVLVEPTRNRINHISNMLLLNDNSKLDNFTPSLPIYSKIEKSGGNDPSNVKMERGTQETGFYKHNSMTRGGTDKRKSLAGKFPQDELLIGISGSQVPPSQVTDRDLQGIKLNPKLLSKLEAEYQKMKNKGNTEKYMIHKLSEIIAKYLGLS